jgi:glycosyltransferase involved in cell wall biosynthesis
MPGSCERPAVSIILPTYNRAKFLPQAFGSIRSQTFTDWELIVVDDGSTDNTKELVAELTRRWQQSVRYVYQKNQGPYGARNTGLDLAVGGYISFFDSDDVWQPEYLSRLTSGLIANPDVDWAYCACRVLNLNSREVLAASTFYERGLPKALLRLPTIRAGDFNVFHDPHLVFRRILKKGCALYCGLQNSVIRRRVFDDYRFRTHHRNEAEDVVTVMRILKAGRLLAYMNESLVDYYVHNDNSSAASLVSSAEKRTAVITAQIQGLEDFRRELRLDGVESRDYDRAMSKNYFWTLGYSTLWQSGRRREALAAFRHALLLWPWDLKYWKTYVACLVRHYFGEFRARASISSRRGAADATAPHV